ncbi:glycosyltransferase family 2 protein [Paracoccus sp. DMF]|uniref:glycosyltransferase family 2 protein n=1 Tax=Paracoccus sp. DMF TaxID=400837 RepID=UPI0021E4EB97|nr:glycosyltransferase family 2 protein [Paracoccus sp. DMF]MCV2446059.1 glycosyltransferase family 2 protein [Paracoccus sp. DMF]
MPLVVTLSSIPPRFAGLEPTLKSLLKQKTRPDEVRLYLPRRYRRFPDWDGSLPAVPQGVRIVTVEDDLGPATKILPAVRDFRGQDCELLLCDDDRLYDPLWTSRFLAARRAHPGCVIAEAGGFVPGHAGGLEPRAVPRRKGWRYRLLRAATLGLVKPHAWLRSGYVDVLKGYGGAMLRPEFMPDSAFDIPELLWTVDDPWLSGNLALNGVPIWLNAEGRVPGECRTARCHALLDFALQGKGRGDANGACYEWFRQNLGIWTAGPSRPSSPPAAMPADSR